MSIAKNTRSRKKVAPPSTGFVSRAKAQAEPRSGVEKYTNLGVVHEAEIRQFVSTLRLSQLRAYGGRFAVLMEALEAARRQPSAQARRAVAKLLADLEEESRERRYRQILHAIAEAVRSEEGISRAAWTALRTVEMIFEWTAEYMSAFNLFTQRVKQERRGATTAPAVKRRGK